MEIAILRGGIRATCFGGALAAVIGSSVTLAAAQATARSPNKYA
jgi:hypothetical protein